ncbi:type III pantothenate kinase [bacterium]|nr:type III pantothenate kinase [bacterium]
MLMAIDIGNTQTAIGIYKNNALAHHWRIETKLCRTADELVVVFKNLYSIVGIDFKDISGIAISSVVPPQDRPIREFAERYFRIDPLFVTAENIGMNIKVDNPSEVGSDRLLSAYAAYHEYKGKLIVVDFGTATTFDCVDSEGSYIGGPIAPGIKISLEALFQRASKLPRVDIADTKTVIGKNTIHCMQAGIFHGYVGLVDHLIDKIKLEMGEPKVVLATGGLAPLVGKGSRNIQKINDNLVLDGLHLIWQNTK